MSEEPAAPSIARNAASLVGARLLAKAAWVVVTFQVAKHLGKGRLGDYAYAMVYVVFFESLATLGLHYLLQRDCTLRPAETASLLGRARALWMRVAVVTPFVMALTSALLGDAKEVTRGVVVVSIGLLFWALGSIYNAVLVSQERMGRVAAIEAIASVARAGLCLGAIWKDGSIGAFLVCYTLSQMLYYVLSWAWCPVRPERPAVADLGPLLRQAAPFALMLLASGLYFRMDIFILKRMRSPEETGLYEAAWRPVNELMTLGHLIAASFFPRLVSLALSDARAFKRLTAKAVVILLVLGGVAGAVGSVFSDALIRVAYGRDFASSAWLLRIVCGCLAAYLPACALTFAIVATGRSWFWTTLLVMKAAVSITLHLLLVPSWGPGGTAIAMLSAEVLAFLTCAVAWLAWAPRDGQPPPP